MLKLTALITSSLGHACSVCGKHYAQKRDLNTHMSWVHDKSGGKVITAVDLHDKVLVHVLVVDIILVQVMVKINLLV